MSADDHDAVVRQSFGKQVGLFTGDDSPFARRPASPLAWVEPLDDSMVVLDVACGAAHVAEQLAPHVHEVVGVDLTPELLEVGAERLRQAGITNVLLQEGNAARLPFADESFDLVVCRGSLHHFPAPAQPVAEMGRVCQPDGRVVVSDMVAPSEEVRAAFDELHRTIDPSHAGALLEAEMADLLSSTVGPLCYADTSEPFSLPIDHMLTEAADRDAVMAALRREVAGGPPTGFNPVVEDGRVVVSFISTVVHAARRRD